MGESYTQMRHSRCIAVRANIDIDDELMNKAMALTGLRTKKAVVDEALKLLVRLKEQEKLKSLFGKLKTWATWC